MRFSPCDMLGENGTLTGTPCIWFQIASKSYIIKSYIANQIFDHQFSQEISAISITWLSMSLLLLESLGIEDNSIAWATISTGWRLSNSLRKSLASNVSITNFGECLLNEIAGFKIGKGISLRLCSINLISVDWGLDNFMGCCKNCRWRSTIWLVLVSSFIKERTTATCWVVNLCNYHLTWLITSNMSA